MLFLAHALLTGPASIIFTFPHRWNIISIFYFYFIFIFPIPGGHTTELLQLASALPPSRYSPSLYLISTNDRFSADKAAQLQSLLASSAPSDIRKEPKQEKGYSILSIPRARAVHQSFLSTPVSVLISFAFCVEHVVRRPLWAKWQCRADDDTRFADLVLMNGPGTCVPLVAAIYISRVSFPLPLRIAN